MKVVLDTHAAIWLAIQPQSLSANAQRALLSLSAPDMVISDVTLTEVARLVALKRITVIQPMPAWLGAWTRGYTVQPVTPEIAWLAALMPWPHRDPCDRHIVATTLALRLPLVTVDATITAAAPALGLKIVW